MYHHVSPVGKGLNVKPEIFEDHLNTLHKNGWKTLSGNEFLSSLKNNDIPSKSVLLTFDDGFANNYLNAFPLLKKFGMKAMLFVATSLIEDTDIKRDRCLPFSHREAWDLAFTERRSEVMCTWNEIKEMHESGYFDIQSHGHSHRSHYLIDEKNYAELENDLLTAKETIEKRLSKKVLHLSWPKGRYDKQGIDIAAKAGFEALYTTKRGYNTASNLKTLKRLPVKGNGKWLVNRLRVYSSVNLSRFYLTIRTGS
jgi:peptidoglycan/xylan/chitin deacetylase (PgdA/CDA1 family)